jgi:serine/threonine protein kinase
VDAKPTQRKQIMRELQILHDCNSPYIVGFYGAYLIQGDVAVVMEYMDCGSLEHLLKKGGKMPEEYIARVTFAVLQGLDYLYRAFHIIHRGNFLRFEETNHLNRCKT